MTGEYRNKMLFIDDAFLQEVHNLKRKVNSAVKHPEPIMKLDAPWNKDDECFNYLNVLYDDQEKVFKMWYDVLGEANQWDPHRTRWAYATSPDGIHWERPILNRIEVRGSKQNNYFTPSMNGFCGSIIIDPSDVPARRYKMLFMLSSYGMCDGMDWAKFHVPVCLAYSADGLTWQRPEHVNPVIRGLSDGGFVFYYDPDRRKYVLVGRRVPNLPRDVSQYESYDLVNWEDKGRILVPGDEFDPPSLFNFQAFAPFPYEDLYLGMLDVQYSLPGAETYEVYHKPPADYPDQRMGIVEFQLAYSRDGQAWQRPRDRSPVVPVGGPDDPDAGVIFAPLSTPFTVNGETYLYYTASRCRHSSWSREELLSGGKHDLRSQTCGMLAKMPEDHWVSLDAGKEEGWLLTTVYATPSRLLVTADARGGSIEAEFLTPYGEPVEGFTRANCMGISGNGKDQQIRWKTDIDLRGLNEKYRGGLCIKFYLKNVKFYSYSLMEPDPEGTIRGYWDNARWNEVIKHRSDNWGRNSNEPAVGLPQPPNTEHAAAARFGPNPRTKAKWS